MKRTLLFSSVAISLTLSGLLLANQARQSNAPAPTAAAKAVKPDGNAKRADIPDAYKWDLSPLFKNDAAFEQGLKKATSERAKLAKFEGKLKDPKKLRQCLELYFETRLLTNKCTLYANMRYDSAQKDTKLQAMSDRALEAMNDLMTQAAFIRQEILALDEKAIKAAYAKEEKLAVYHAYVEELRRRRARVLNPEAERVLSLAGDNLWAEIDLNEIPSDHEKTFGGLLTDVPLPKIKDEAGKQVQLTLSNYGKFRASDKREVRRDAVEALFGTLKQYQHGFAGTFAGQVRFNIFLARSRGYKTALEAYLDKDDIDPKVYLNLIKSIRGNLRPLHKYVKLRKKVMGLKELHIYDLYTPMVPSVKMAFPYSQARKILPEVLAPLGEDYTDVLAKGMDPKSGWIDLYPHQDKGSGAFSSSVYGVHPYVKMNYYDEVDDLSTLAHEYGHAMHSYLSIKEQPYVTAGYAPFVAEIASTLNEKLLSDYLVKNAKNDDEKLFILNELVETIRTTIYRQTLFAEFEYKAHSAAERGTPLTADWLNDTYKKLIHSYYGKDFSVGPNDDIEWAYVPHFYYKYYMFTYATGLSSGIALAERVERYGDKAREDYLTMLKAGSSAPPLELLKRAGVDLTKPQAIAAAARLMDRTLDEMEKILKKQKKLK